MRHNLVHFTFAFINSLLVLVHKQPDYYSLTRRYHNTKGTISTEVFSTTAALKHSSHITNLIGTTLATEIFIYIHINYRIIFI
jgi:hypothetical protein